MILFFIHPLIRFRDFLSFSIPPKNWSYYSSQVRFCPDNVGCYEDSFVPIQIFWFFFITRTFLCTFSLCYLLVDSFISSRKFFLDYLSLSLHYNKTVWHALINKMIVSVIISDTTVCASLHFWLHYKPDMIFPNFPYFPVSWKILLNTFKNIKWRQEIHCVITNWRENVYHGISQLIQYFFK